MSDLQGALVAGRVHDLHQAIDPGLLMPMQDVDPYNAPGFALGEVVESAALPG